MTARWTYGSETESLETVVPALVLVGFDEIRRALSLQDHRHPGCYEFVYMEKGHAAWELEGEVFETRAGELFHTKPGERHRGRNEVIEPSRFWWLIVQAPNGTGWMGLPPNEQALFAKAFRSLPRVGDVGPLPAEAFRKLRRSLQERGPFAGIRSRQAVLELLLLFADGTREQAPVAADLIARFGEITARLANDSAWRPTVGELAAYCSVSESHFYRSFLAHAGMSPMQYAERLRMREACRRLEETADGITAIAHELGFTSSQHFSTVFKRLTGMTPTGWRRAERRLSP